MLGLMSTALEITTKDGKKFHFRTFAGSAKRDEAFELLSYLTHVPHGEHGAADGDPIPILLKEPSGALHSALMLLRDDSFAVYNDDGSEQLDAQKYRYGKLSWSFADIESIQLRARPLHVDVRFNDGSQRLRIAVAHTRMFVVRLVSYAETMRPEPPLEVTFEPGIEEFDPRGSEYEPVAAVVVKPKSSPRSGVVPHKTGIACVLGDSIEDRLDFDQDADDEFNARKREPATASAAVSGVSVKSGSGNNKWSQIAENDAILAQSNEIERVLSSSSLTAFDEESSVDASSAPPARARRESLTEFSGTHEQRREAMRKAWNEPTGDIDDDQVSLLGGNDRAARKRRASKPRMVNEREKPPKCCSCLLL